MGNVKASLCFGFGYLLVFAAFYQGGRYALRPWAALQA
jgi:hypothetical protein